MSKNKIKYLLLDLAGVVINLNIERDTEALLEVGLPDFMGCLKNPEIRGVIEPYLNGLLDADVFCDRMRPFCREEITDEDILWAMDAVLDRIPRERLERIRTYRQKYKVYLLTNIYERAWEYVTRQIESQGFQTEDCFDQVFLSYEMQLAKPDKRIFQKVIESTGLVPEETLYLDDTKENIEAARTMGFQAHVVPINGLDKWFDLWRE